MNPSHILARWAERTPNREAVIGVERRLTWANLRKRVDELAVSLQGLGVKPGDRVGLLLHNGPEFLAA